MAAAEHLATTQTDHGHFYHISLHESKEGVFEHGWDWRYVAAFYIVYFRFYYSTDHERKEMPGVERLMTNDDEAGIASERAALRAKRSG